MIDKILIKEYPYIFEYSNTLKASHYTYKVDWEAYVMLVDDKLYALFSIHNDKPIIILKGLPEENEFLINNFKSVTPGYHMNKQHWFNIELDENEFTNEQIYNFIKQSYKLVIAKMTKKKKEELGL